MKKQVQEMMVYVIMGLLEAGKTSLITDLLAEELYDEEEKTLILACEEGEEEYEPAELARTGAVCEFIEKEEDFSRQTVEGLLKKYRPDRIIMEYNGMWPVEHIKEMLDTLQDICFDREVISQIVDVVNEETFNLYMKNMPSIMVEQFKVAEVIIVNRCTVYTNKLTIRGRIKAVNPRVQIVYESQDAEFYEMEEQLPYDVNADVIEIRENDFGLWYVDLLDHPQTYVGKTIRVAGLIQKSPGLPKGFAVFGRYAMTCCAEDVQYMGFLCKADSWRGFRNRQYVTVTARLEYKYMDEYGEEGPVFYADKVVEAQKPKEELVFFS